jgi:hypothetical protein
LLAGWLANYTAASYWERRRRRRRKLGPNLTRRFDSKPGEAIHHGRIGRS